jgi:hypothetical protein
MSYEKPHTSKPWLSDNCSYLIKSVAQGLGVGTPAGFSQASHAFHNESYGLEGDFYMSGSLKRRCQHLAVMAAQGLTHKDFVASVQSYFFSLFTEFHVDSIKIVFTVICKYESGNGRNPPRYNQGRMKDTNLLFSILAGLAIGFWIYGDAQNRKLKNALFWGIIGFLFSLLGLFSYWLWVIRPDKRG